MKLEAGYASVSGDEEYLFHDISIGDVTVTAVLAPALAVGARARMARQADSSRTSADAMARLYLGSPLTVAEPSGCNPDGRVGLPIVVVTGGADLADGGRGVDRWRVDAALALPLSSHWSLGAGYLWLEKLRPGDPVQGYGLVRWYSHAYSAGALYENPDGLPGTVNVAFRAGASSRGSLGQLDFRVPLDGGTTVGVGGEVISLDARSEKRLTARISLTWYPH